MQVTINGRGEDFPGGLTVAELLRRLAVEPIRVAVEINHDLVPRATFAETFINEGDRIEVVTFVGGG